MAAQPSFLSTGLYAYLMKENPRFNGIVQLKNPGRRRTMSWLIKKYKERFANAGDLSFFRWKYR
jgi:zinc protease